MSSPLEAAHQYAERGWPVLPIRPPTGSDNGKTPYTRNGLNDATVDHQRIDRWWQAWPDAGVGIRTGVTVDVLDIDDQGGGLRLAELVMEMGGDRYWMGWGPMAVTGRGHHLYYAVSGIGNRAAVAGIPGVDFRGAGGYVIAPPSRHHNGHTYEWHEDCPLGAPLPALPAQLRTLLTRNQTRPVDRATHALQPSPNTPSSSSGAAGWSPAGLIRAVATAPEGRRNDVLNWAAYQLGRDARAHRGTEQQIDQAIDELHAAALAAGLTRTETDKTIESGFKTGAGIP